MVSLRSRIFLQLIRWWSPPLDPDAAIPEQREKLEKMTGRIPVPRDVSVETLRVAGRPAEWLRPADARADRAILYLHGGGYCVGSAISHRSLAARVGVAARASVLLLEYRLAPEHPFPAGLDDAVAAMEWIAEGGVAPPKIGIVGDSAGGGLTLATALRLRDQRRPLPGALVCLSPWTDLTVSSESAQTAAPSDPILDAELGTAYAQAYLRETDPRSPLASPVFADFSGFPPVMIQVGDREILLEDSVRLAEAVRRAGVEVDFEVWRGMWHVWQMTPQVPEARRAVNKIGAFLEARLGQT